MQTVSVILLASPVHQQSIARTFEVFAALKEISEIVVVCKEEEREFFSNITSLTFVSPGERRQDSVYKALLALRTHSTLVCIHDLAEPVLTLDLLRRVCLAAVAHGAATVGTKIPYTIKEAEEDHFVTNTLDRAYIWEAKTPQVVKVPLLEKGFDVAIRHNLDVVDEVSLVELIGEPVKIVDGTQERLKLSSESDAMLLRQMKAKFNIKS